MALIKRKGYFTDGPIGSCAYFLRSGSSENYGVMVFVGTCYWDGVPENTLCANDFLGLSPALEI